MIKHPYTATESGQVIAVVMGRQLVIYFGDQGFILSNPSVPQLREHTTVESFQGDTPEQLLARIREQLPTFDQANSKKMTNENLPAAEVASHAEDALHLAILCVIPQPVLDRLRISHKYNLTKEEAVFLDEKPLSKELLARAEAISRQSVAPTK